MNTNPLEFYNPLAIALGGAKLQDFVDEILAVQNNALEIDGFSWNEDLLPDFTYSQVQKELGIEVMASYVDLDSPALPIDTEGDVIATGKIPRMKGVEYYNEDKLRKLKLMELRRDYDRAALISNAGVEVARIINKLVTRHSNSIKYQRHQIVSTGKFTLTSTNNPLGINGVTFANHVPAANITTKATDARWWTSATHTSGNEGSAATPIEDLKKMVRDARKKGVVNVHFEVNDTFMDDILGLTEVKNAIKSNLFTTAGTDNLAAGALLGVARETQIIALGRVVGAPFKCWNSQVSVKKLDNSTKKLVKDTFDAFASNVVVLVPDSGIGEILTVEPILLEGGEYAFGFGRKCAITIGKDYVKKCQSYNSEMTSLVVPNVPQYMWYLKPCEV